jgi:hypothetical protein
MLDSQYLKDSTRKALISVTYPEVEVILANYISRAIWAFPVLLIVKSNMTKTPTQNGKKQIHI